MTTLRLYGYFNSSAAYRVRIALALKQLPWESQAVNLRAGVHLQPEYTAVNAARLVPALVHGERVITQSLAIIDYLDQIAPNPCLIPATGPDRTRALEIANVIACDIHPINNLRVLKYLQEDLRIDQDAKQRWYAHWIRSGFDVLEALLPSESDAWCLGEAPSVADCCLVPQVANAMRFKVDLEPWPRIRRANAYCCAQAAIRSASPLQQADCVSS